MEKMKSGSVVDAASEKTKKKYLRPELSLISFATEKGFANSVFVPDTSIKATTVDDQSTTTWI